MRILKRMHRAAVRAGASDLPLTVTTGPYHGEDGYTSLRLAGWPHGSLIYWHCSAPWWTHRVRTPAHEWHGLVPTGTHCVSAIAIHESRGAVSVGLIEVVVRVGDNGGIPTINTNGGKYGGA